jgi:hypothetical protein
MHKQAYSPATGIQDDLLQEDNNDDVTLLNWRTVVKIG